MSHDILTLTDVRKSFGEAQIIRGVNLKVEAGERHAVIGPNGAGKSTLFHLMSGSFAPTSGVHRQFYMCSQLILSFNLGLCQLTGLSLAIH
jgi:ABC-type branched-subunit amino acid transport system ATPase component